MEKRTYEICRPGSLNMKRYLKIYLLFIKLNYTRALVHRGDFFTGLSGSLAWGIFSIVAVYILSSRSSSIYGWSRGELFILIGVFNIIVGSFFRMVNGANFETMSVNIQRGDLDSLLIKPIDSQFFLSFLHIKLHGLIRFLIAIIYTVIVFNLAHISFTIFSLFLAIFFGIVGFLIIYSTWYLVMTATIWFPDLYNLSEILYTADGITRYPPQVLWAMKAFVFLIFFPYTLVVSVPTKALIHKLTFLDALLAMGFACGLLFLSRKFWKFALRYYTSASG